MALYREYRPKTFDDVLGQDHIINTIRNQINNNNIGHAYLFSGTRGTGKTSTAKIFSRAVNCLEPENGSPCNKCEICKGILDGSIMDVMEMDAASNRGVNDIRELRDKVSYPPSYARYKVYIIDEVHMLTQEAFNALLKTLEEPPKHLIFILATTEPEKIPQTILSRCQRFDFKRIENDVIKENMEKIIESLDIEIETEALDVIARNADGGMRDALSLLEKCISFSSDKLVRYEDVISVLGIVNVDTIFTIIDSVIDRSIEDILISINEMIEDGRDVHQFIKDIIYHFRNLMMIKTFEGANSLVEVDSYTLEKYLKQADGLKLDYIIRILDILSEIDEKAKSSTEPRVLLEMAFLKILRSENLSFEERLEKLEAGNFTQGPASLPEKSLEKRVETKEAKLEETSKSSEKKVRKINPVSDKDLINLRKNWGTILETVKSVQVSTSVLLKNGEVTFYDGNFVDISFQPEFVTMKNLLAGNANNKKIIEEVLSKFLDNEIEVRFGESQEIIEETEAVDENVESKVEGLFKALDDNIKIEIKD